MENLKNFLKIVEPSNKYIQKHKKHENGNGYGNENGDLKSLNNQSIYIIDNIQTIIINVKSNIAKGFIVNKDLTLTSCYIAKNENYFAHGETIHKALKALKDKLLICLPIEQRIINFKKKFSSLKRKYKAIDYYNWHYYLTGSCNIGRMSFIKNNNIDLHNDKFTVLEFIDIVKKEYGYNIINIIKEHYKIIN